jgi:FAD dependent oxidoreductase.
MSQTDLIIVGQGLAGSAIAMQSITRGYKILVLDQPSQNRSSVIAAGIFNPITGRNLVKTWLGDQIFSFLFQYYAEAERLTGKSFFYPMAVYRPFASVEEQNEWMGKSSDSIYSTYISGLSPSSCLHGQVKDPFGGITLKQTGYLNTRAYLDAVREYLEVRGSFYRATFDPEKLKIGPNSVRYENTTAEKIIFCQGVHNTTNPWFKSLPINPLKGEVLTIQSPLEKDVILSRGVYLVPGTEPDEWRAGATYNWDDQSLGITSQARNELTSKLQELIRIPYTVTGQDWGLRPTTPDRKPIIGEHPEHHALIIFNGFGMKGVSLAPYFSDILIRWMEKRGTINKEADVTRFN